MKAPYLDDLQRPKTPQNGSWRVVKIRFRIQ